MYGGNAAKFARGSPYMVSNKSKFLQGRSPHIDVVAKLTEETFESSPRQTLYRCF